LTFPEYTVSLLIWVVPLVVLAMLFIKKRLLSPEKWFALLVSVGIMAFVGIALDLMFAGRFFTFPEPRAVLGITIRYKPVEEFVFYITGFWFILFFYVFCDEWYLVKYNVPDKKYARYRSRLKKLVFIRISGVFWAIGFFAAAVLIKRIFNPGGDLIPGYFTFLLIVAYVPFILFIRVTRHFVNGPAFMFSLVLTMLISVIWEVTLALPRGYWGYQEGAMMGIFIEVWHRLPMEAVTVWVFCTLVILVYEFLKIRYFTPLPTVPGYKMLLRMGHDWRSK
jgi:hypothetical protein